jgi:hypothetical protein
VEEFVHKWISTLNVLENFLMKADLWQTMLFEPYTKAYLKIAISSWSRRMAISVHSFLSMYSLTVQETIQRPGADVMIF